MNTPTDKDRTDTQILDGIERLVSSLTAEFLRLGRDRRCTAHGIVAINQRSAAADMNHTLGQLRLETASD
jgi:hypothetical protein